MVLHSEVKEDVAELSRNATNSWSDPQDVFKPYGKYREGLFTFRGNPSRTFYGSGPIPDTSPTTRWSFPKDSSMCSVSYVGQKADTWCGLGWTGQPAVFKWRGKTVIVFGGFDKKVHYLDASTGVELLRPLETGDIIKGTATVDPDGYPLIYIGSRDNNMRIISFDQGKLKELWRFNAYSVSPVLWDDDWDASPLVLRGFLLTGGENGHFHAIRLNRSYDSKGFVSVSPRLVANVQGWDSELLRVFPKPAVSIENSISIHNNIAYFANSAGLVQGWDLDPLLQGKRPKRIYRFWTGDDTDATIVVDKDGMLYVASEYELNTARSRAVGQILKLNPHLSGDSSVIWSKRVMEGLPDGIWSTPALTTELLIVTTHRGKVLGLNKRTGKTEWSLSLGNQPLWSSPVVLGRRLMIPACDGTINTYKLNGYSRPTLLWSKKISSGCFEATAAVWNGRIYIGNRDGRLYGIW